MNKHQFYYIMCGISYISAVVSQQYPITEFLFGVVSVIYGVLALFTKEQQKDKK